MSIAPIKGSVKCDFKDIAGLLRQLPDKFIKQDVRVVQKEQWEEVAKEARRLVPVDTGRLKEMIVVKAGYSKKAGAVFATVALRRIGRRERGKVREKKLQRSLGYAVKTDGIEYDSYYGVFVEFGDQHQKAQPFMRPAFDTKHREILANYTVALEARLTRRLEKLKDAPTKRI